MKKTIKLTWNQVRDEFSRPPYTDNNPAVAFEMTFEPGNPYTPDDFIFWLEYAPDVTYANDPNDPGFLPTRPGFILCIQAPDEPMSLTWDGDVWS